MSDVAGIVTIVVVITALVLAVGWVLIKMDEAAGPRQSKPKDPDRLGGFGWGLLILCAIACPPMVLIMLVVVAKAPRT